MHCNLGQHLVMRIVQMCNVLSLLMQLLFQHLLCVPLLFLQLPEQYVIVTDLRLQL